MKNIPTTLLDSRYNLKLALPTTIQVKIEHAIADITKGTPSFRLAAVRSTVMLEINASSNVKTIREMLIVVEVPMEYLAIISNGQW